jgi:hypothetical protein
MTIQPGDMVRISEHRLRGYEWTVGAVGSVKLQAHVRDFDARHIPKARREANTPPLRPGWWVVSVEHRRAKGGFALATLPEECLAPHACTARCPKHLCMLGA